MLDKSNKLVDLNNNEDSMRSHVFRRSKCQELNEWDLHCQKGSQNVENVVCCDNFVHFFFLFSFMSDQSKQDKDWNDVDDE